MEEAELFDMIIPPGVPRRIIASVLTKFDVTLVSRREKLSFANMDGMERDLLAFRGKKEVIEKVEKYVRAELETFIGNESGSGTS